MPVHPPMPRSVAVRSRFGQDGGMPQEDEVDRIVAAWGRERDDLDFAPLEVFSRVDRLARHLDRARRAAFDASGVEPWEFDVLSALRRAGEPYELSPKTLLQQTLVSSGTMTNRVDRLAARGLVSRRTDPRDGRGILVALTPSGGRRSTPRSRTCSPLSAGSSTRCPARSRRSCPVCCDGSSSAWATDRERADRASARASEHDRARPGTTGHDRTRARASTTGHDRSD